MVARDDDPSGSPEESRPPTLKDLVSLCRELNARKAKYVVIGGMAVLQLGFVRATEDIDLLVDTSPENEKRVLEALACLPDHAAREIKPGELEKYEVIRVADEIVVDLMKSACGIDFAQAEKEILRVEFDGVQIPFASAELLWKMKQGLREKDALDRAFLAQLMKK